jgi:hypothetical protein
MPPPGGMPHIQKPRVQPCGWGGASCAHTSYLRAILLFPHHTNITKASRLTGAVIHHAILTTHPLPYRSTPAQHSIACRRIIYDRRPGAHSIVPRLGMGRHATCLRALGLVGAWLGWPTPPARRATVDFLGHFDPLAKCGAAAVIYKAINTTHPGLLRPGTPAQQGAPEACRGPRRCVFGQAIRGNGSCRGSQ